MRNQTLVVTALAALAAAAALSSLTACTASAPAAPHSATPTPVSTADWPTASVFKEGRASTSLVLPSGAKSLHVDFACTAGLYEVSPANGTVDARHGTCGGSQSFDFDVSRVSPGSRVGVDLVIPDDSRLTASVRFSPKPVARDAATAKSCAALSGILSAYFDSDQAVDHGDLTTDGWRTETAAARADLTALASAEDGPGPNGPLHPVIPQLASWLTGEGDHPGAVLHAVPGDFAAADQLAGQVCEGNGTPIEISSSYGG